MAELELKLAQQPSLYLRLDLTSRVVQVMVRGFELDMIQAESVRLVVHRAPGQPGLTAEEALPAVWRVASAPSVVWRRVVAPQTLVPYREDAAPPTPLPTSTPPPEPPAQYQVQLDNGWVLHVGPDPPDRWRRRVADRIGTGWRRLTGRATAPPPPAVVVVTAPADSRRLLHILTADSPVLVFCGSSEPPPSPAPGDSPGGAAAATPGSAG